MMSSPDDEGSSLRSSSQHETSSNRKSAGILAFRVIFSFTRRSHLLIIAVAFLLAAISGIIKPIISILVGRFLSTFSRFAAGSIDDATLTTETRSAILGLVTVGAAVCLVKGAFCTAWITFGESQARVVRDELFSALLVRDLEWFQEQKTGVSSLLSRIQAQIRDLQLGVSQPLGFATISVVQSFTSIGVAFYYNWKLTLILLGVFPCITITLSFISRGFAQSVTDQQQGLTLATKQATHAMNNVTMLRCLDTQAAEADRYTQILDKVMLQFRKQTQITATQTGFMRTAATGLLVLALFVGTCFVHNEGTDAGAIMTAFWCCVSASRGFSEVLTQIIVLEKGRAAAVALKGLLTRVKRGKSLAIHAKGQSPPNLEGDIEFHHVSFSYPSRPLDKILDDVNLFFPAHETTYVVGKTGSGKSTLSSLLLKFFAATHGRVTIDGLKIGTLETSWLRNNVTLVQQDSVLFNGTIYENIMICKENSRQPDASELQSCIDFAQLEATVGGLPDGLSTRVGKNGTTLSGGRRQRLALARARIRDTPILILDEFTSALDQAAKSQVMKNVRHWRAGKTTVVITHDLSQIRSGDFVYVLKNGKVISEGYRSAVQAQLIQTNNDDMIGTPSTFVDDDTVSLNPISEQINRILRPRTLPLRPNASVSSLESALSDCDAGSEIDLLGASKTPRKIESAFRQSLATFARVAKNKQYRSTGMKTKYTDEAIESESKQNQVSRPRKLHNRLTIAPGARPYSTHPASTLRSTYFQQDTSPATPVKPISINVNIFPNEQGSTPTPMPTSLPPLNSYSMMQILGTVYPSLQPKDRHLLALALTCALTYATIPSISAWGISHLFQNFHQRLGWVQDARKWSLILCAIGILDTVSAYTIHYLFETLGCDWIHKLRHEALSRIMLQPKSWFDGDSQSVTEICNTLDRAADEVRAILSRMVSFVLIAIVMVSVSIIWSLIVCWKLTLVTLSSAPVIFAVTKLFDFVSMRWESRTSDAAETIADIFAESFFDVQTVRALTLEFHFHRKYTTATSRAFLTGIKRGFYISLCYGASDSTLPLTVASIFSYGISLARSREASTSSILTVFSLLLFSMISASSILGYIPQLGASVDAANRLLRLTNLPLESHEQEGAIKPDSTSFQPRIRFRNLSFSYPTRPDAPVLRDLNLTIAPGECLALVGRSGSGKSTILSLLLGLYPCGHKTDSSASPALLISSHNIRTLHLPTLRSHIAYMPQQPVLFPMTIRENILYGLTGSDATGSHLESAARAAGIHTFISSLPDAYNTVVGDGGTGVSGGQAQRIVLARTFARRPKILLLDEPTSALDQESAEIIRESIRALMRKGRGDRPTIVIVTHAMEMMEMADRVAVFEGGRIVEDGGFRELLRRGKGGALFELLRSGEE